MITPRVIWERTFDIERKPRPKNQRNPVLIAGRPRMVTAPEVKLEQAAIAALIAPFAPPARHEEGPVEVELVSYFEIPAGWPAWKREAALAGVVRPTGRPDLDNLMKMITDAMGASGRWFRDDAQIVGNVHAKAYAPLPLSRVTVRFLEDVSTAAAWKARRELEDWRAAERDRQVQEAMMFGETR